MERDEALAAFIRREHPRLVGALSLYCGDPALAEEFAQEALLRAVDRWSRLCEMAAPGAWVHRTAMNLAHSWFRRLAAERRAHVRVVGGEQPHRDPDVAERHTVRRAVAALPRRQRQALVLRHYLGYEMADVAAAMELKPSAVAALTYRAMESLRAALGERDEEVRDAR